MSTESCAICGPKRISRALCNCCGQYLCREHLKEHDDLLNAQLEPLVDNINQLADRLQQLTLDSLLRSTRSKLDQWRQAAFRSIERIYEHKTNELNTIIGRQLESLREQTEEIQRKAAQLVRDQEATNEHIEYLSKTIQNIEQQTNELRHKSVEVHIRPLILEDNYIEFNQEVEEIVESKPLTLTPVVQTISSTPTNVDCIACNDNFILLHRHPTLCLYDHNLNLVKHTHPYSDLSITDMCWSLTLNRFIILTNEDVLLLDEKKMIIEKCNIPTRTNGHWHSITCSVESLYLTAYKWGTNIYQYNIRVSLFEFNRRWQSPITCTTDESIDHLIHNYNKQIAMIVQNRIDNNKHFQLRFDQTFECLWSVQLNRCEMTIHRNRFCLIHQHEWLIIDSKQSHLLYISRDGLFKQMIDYTFDQPLRALETKPNFLLLTTNRSVNLHQLL